MTVKEREEVCFDLETYPNYVLFSFKLVKSGKLLNFELRGHDQRLTERDKTSIRNILNSRDSVSFNGLNFDIPLIQYALKGAPAEAICDMANDIIENKLFDWQTRKQYKLEWWDLRHIDMAKLGPSVGASLKLYGARMHAPKIQDLPIEPNTWLAPAQMDDILAYCENDLDTTILMRNTMHDRVELGKSMSRTYKLNLLSKSDAQIAEAVILSQIEAKLKRKVVRPNAPKYVMYKAPDYLQFKTKTMQDVLALIQEQKFTFASNGKLKIPTKLNNKVFKIGRSSYKIGNGGLHSQEKGQSVVPTSRQILRDRDVTSYYPSIIMLLGLFPPQCTAFFNVVYQKILDDRVVAKRMDKDLAKKLKTMTPDMADYEDVKVKQLYYHVMNEALKVCVNGSFGKLGSKWSKLFAPELMLAITITGQLSLLMIIEELTLCGFDVVSGNTDGFVTLMDKDRYDEFDAICADWSLITGYNLEEAEYSAMFSRGVNSYFALTPDGSFKGKGDYAEPWLKISPSGWIVSQAVVNYIRDGKPFLETLHECKDIRDFLYVRTVKGGAVHNGESLGRVVRWFYHKDGSPIRYKSNGDKVSLSNFARPLQVLSDKSPEELGVWYDYYEGKCIDLYESTTGEMYIYD